MKRMKFANWTANKILTLTANVLFGSRLTDEATAYKAFRREVVDAIELRCMRFEFCPEVTAKVRRLGYQIHDAGELQPSGHSGRQEDPLAGWRGSDGDVDPVSCGSAGVASRGEPHLCGPKWRRYSA